MKESEVVLLLGGISEFQHQQVNDLSVQMWANTLTPDMTVQFALAFATRHFAASSDNLKPADFNAAWAEQQNISYLRDVVEARELDHVGDAGYEYASDPGTAYLPVQRTSRATPEVVELFFAAHHDAKKGGRTHADGRPYAVQDYFDEVIPLMEAAGRAAREDPLDRHCGFKGCLCLHIDDCYRGWLEGPKCDDGQAHACRICRESLSATLDKVPGPGLRSDIDFAVIRSHAKDDH